MALSQSHSCFSLSGTVGHGSKSGTEAKTTKLCFEKPIERIKNMFDKTELSISSYDTAWVAMVPSPETPQAPCFPQCINWLLDNQLDDGSWGLPNRPSWLVKDAVSCTLACVLALKRWGIGEEQMYNGIQFIKSNFTSVMDEKQQTPVGFDIIFPGMIECAQDLNLNLPLRSGDVTAMLERRHLALKRNHTEGRKEYLAYVSEGIGKLQDWEMVMKYQRNNGSLFNSPSTTAAALFHLQNADCLHYLSSVLEKFRNGVPTVHPLDIYIQLVMIESLESLGIDRHFRTEIKRVLDKTYRNHTEGRKEYLAYVSEGIGKLQDWEMVMKYQRNNGSLFNSPSTTAAALIHLQNADCLHYLSSVLEKFRIGVPTVHPLDIYIQLVMIESLESLGIDRHFRTEIKRGEEEIYLEPATCALAFRLLRINGYDVSSDALTQFAEDNQFFNSLKGYLKDINAVLELYRASQIIIDPDELVLEKQNLWTSNFLKQELSSGSIQTDGFGKYDSSQVEDALKFPFHANLERLAHRRNFNHYNIDNTMILKTSYRSLNIGNKYFQKLAVYDFNICQSVLYEELEQLERWVMEKRLDKLKFARQKQAYCYFSVAATLFSPELSDARMSWAKNAVLTTIVDDFYDLGGSDEEMLNLIELLEKWNAQEGINCCSEQVEIIFSALHCTICELGDKTVTWQGRNATSHIVETWLNLVKSMYNEADCLRNKSVPTVEEYMENAYTSFGLGPLVFPAVYFVGPKLPEEVVRGSEFHNLFKLVSTCGRLLNDFQGFKRESKEGKLNAVPLHMINSNGVITEAEAIDKIKDHIKSTRRELLRLVLKEEGSIVPRACKDLIWKMSKALHLFYMNTDGFTSNVEMIKAVSEVVYEPISM